MKKLKVLLGILGVSLLAGCSLIPNSQKQESVVIDVDDNAVDNKNQNEEQNDGMPEMIPLSEYLLSRITKTEESSIKSTEHKIYYDDKGTVICESNYDINTKSYLLRFYDEYDNLFIIRDTVSGYLDPIDQMLSIYKNNNNCICYVENEYNGWKFETDENGVPFAWCSADNIQSGSIEYIGPEDGYEYFYNEYKNIYVNDFSNAIVVYPYEDANVADNYYYDINTRELRTFVKTVSIQDLFVIIQSVYDDNNNLESISLNYDNHYYENGVALDSIYEDIPEEIKQSIPNEESYDLSKYRVFYENNKIKAIATTDYAWFYLYTSDGFFDKVFDIYLQIPQFNNNVNQKSAKEGCHASSRDILDEYMPQEGEQLAFEYIWEEDKDGVRSSRASYRLLTDYRLRYCDILKGKYFDKIKLMRADNKLISFVAEDNGVIKGLNYEPFNGEELSIDFIVKDFEGLKEFVHNKYNLTLDINNLNWYVDRNNIYFVEKNRTTKISAEEIAQYLNLENDYGQCIYVAKNKTYKFDLYEMEPLEIDIDCDGIIETISFDATKDVYDEYDMVCMKVEKNGTISTYKFPNDDYGYEENIYLVDMADGNKYLYLNDCSSNDWATLYGYSFNTKNGIKEICKTSTNTCGYNDLEADGFWKVDYDALLGSHYTLQWTTISEDGTFVYHTNKIIDRECLLTLKMDLDVDVDDFDGTHVVTIPAGTKLIYKEIYDNNVAILAVYDEQYEFFDFTIKMDGENCEFYYKGISECDLFDGIGYAG